MEYVPIFWHACHYRFPMASRAVATARQHNPKVSHSRAWRDECFHSPVITPESVAVTIIKIWKSLPSYKEGEWWAEMDEVFHAD